MREIVKETKEYEKIKNKKIITRLIIGISL
jgi:hypothetical protein